MSSVQVQTTNPTSGATRSVVFYASTPGLAAERAADAAWAAPHLRYELVRVDGREFTAPQVDQAAAYVVREFEALDETR